jgi:hypothetical protein
MTMEAARLNRDVDDLARSWSARATSFRKWYRLIELYNDLKQDKMESVISSDPRTAFNMAAWLLTPQTSNFRVDDSNMTDLQIASLPRVEAYVDGQLTQARYRSRGTLFGDIITRAIRMMLATGWYCIFSAPSDNGWALSVWNPASAFPEYDGDGNLIRLARRYTITADEANRKVVTEGWIPPSRPFTRDVTVRNLWRSYYGLVSFQASMDNHLAQPESLTLLRRIPVYTAPVAGLPDDGSITGDSSWRGEVGQSLVAAVLDIGKNLDKTLTYIQQLGRDTANPRWMEESESGNIIQYPDQVYERGAVFKGKVGEKVYPVAPASIPPDLRMHEFDLHGQWQRGTFSDISYGNLTQQVSAVLMSQVTAGTLQTLTPFKDGLMALLGDIASENVELERTHGMKMGQDSYPRLPRGLHFSFNYEIQVPGDFINRANSAMILNRNFRLSETTLIDILFPEVKSAVRELGRIQAEDAANSDIMKMEFLITELGRAAEEARRSGDLRLAQRLRQRLDQMENPQGVGQSNQPPVPGETNQLGPPGLPPEVQQVLRS